MNASLFGNYITSIVVNYLVRSIFESVGLRIFRLIKALIECLAIMNDGGEIHHGVFPYGNEFI